MLKKYKTILFLLFVISSFAGSQFANAQKVNVNNEKLISDGIDYPLSEPHLIVDPNNPNHLLVAAILTKEWVEGQSPDSYIVLLQSRDGGNTWKDTHFDKNIALGADPWLAMNKRNTVVLTSLNRKENEGAVGLFAFVSSDGGQTWNKEPLHLGNGHDRQSIVVDPITQNFIIASAQRNYSVDNKFVWGLKITRLVSNGTLREAIFHPLSNIDKNNGVPVITPDNELIVPYVDYLVDGKLLETRRNWLIKSNDMGRTFSAPVLMSEGGRYPRILLDTLDSGPSKIHYLRSRGELRDYKGFVSKTSSDHGYTWSEEVDVDQYEGENAYIRSPEWTINKEGVIGVFWYDRRANPDTENHHLYFTYSEDHGKNYAEPIQISSEPSKPDTTKMKIDMVYKRWPVGGDYFGLDTLPDGRFQVVWVDYRSGRPQLYTADVKVEE